jgi:hypothetical protein
MSSQPNLQLVRTITQQVVAPTGAGRLLDEAYQATARHIAEFVGHFAHQMGHGPEAVAASIWARFRKQDERLTRLAELRDPAIDQGLEKECLKLMSYALP